MAGPDIISLNDAFQQLTFFGERQPDTSDEDLDGAFATVGSYRDGGLFIGHYAGNSQWERHGQGDELVYVLEGETTLVLLQDGKELPKLLSAGEMLVVPQGTWHRFETPSSVKIFTATPQPTDHRIDHPGR